MSWMYTKTSTLPLLSHGHSCTERRRRVTLERMAIMPASTSATLRSGGQRQRVTSRPCSIWLNWCAMTTGSASIQAEKCELLNERNKESTTIIAGDTHNMMLDCRIASCLLTGGGDGLTLIPASPVMQVQCFSHYLKHLNNFPFISKQILSCYNKLYATFNNENENIHNPAEHRKYHFTDSLCDPNHDTRTQWALENERMEMEVLWWSKLHPDSTIRRYRTQNGRRPANVYRRWNWLAGFDMKAAQYLYEYYEDGEQNIILLAFVRSRFCLYHSLQLHDCDATDKTLSILSSRGMTYLTDLHAICFMA